MSQKSNKKNARPAAAAGAKPAAATGSSHFADELEPRAETGSIPAWLFVLLAVLVYWGMLHLDRYGGGFKATVYGPYQSEKQLADLQPKSGPEMLVAKGEAIYGQVCSVCHQPSGLGSPGQFPPLAGSEWAQGPASRVIRIPLHGLTGPVTVKGEVWDKSMPGFGSTPPLDSDENIAAVLTYVRQAWGNKAPPILPEQVKAIRAETSARSAQWTADELLKVAE